MAERGGRSYRELGGRTTRKSRDSEQERIPGNQSSPKRLQDAFDVADDGAVVVEVNMEDPGLEAKIEGDPSLSAPSERTKEPDGHPNEDTPTLEERYNDDPEGTEPMATKEVHVPAGAEVKEYYSTAELAKDYPGVVASSDDDDDDDDEEEKDETEEKDEKKKDDDARDKKGCDDKGPGISQGCGGKEASTKETNVAMDNIPEINIAEVEVIDDGTQAPTPKEASFADKLRHAMEDGYDEGTMPPMPEMPQMESAPELDMSVDVGAEGAPQEHPPCDCPGTAPDEVPSSPEMAGEGAPSAPVQSEEEGIVAVDEAGSSKASSDDDVTDADLDAEADTSATDADPDDAKTTASVPDADETVYETLGNIEALAEVTLDRVELFLVGEESPNPHYIVTVDGDPIAKVALADQPASLVNDHSNLFTDDGYPSYVLEGIGQFGLPETLRNVHARLYTAAAYSGEVAQEMRTAAVSDLQEDHLIQMATTKDNLINAANIVLQGSLKNYILDNPLKDALVRNMRAAGVAESAAVNAVEDAWTETAPQFFANTLAKAEEWLGAPAEVLEHHIKEISAMSYRHPGFGPSEEEIEVAAQVGIDQIPGNVPIRTTASVPYAPQQRQAAAPQSSGQWNKDHWKQRLNLHGRVAQASMANYNPGGNKR